MSRVKQEDPPSHRHARQSFLQQKIPFTQIVRVNPEAVLYVDEEGRPMTAWSQSDGKAVKFYREPGFPAWPSPYLGDN